MELWIWFSALAAGVVILLSAIAFVLARALSLGKKLKPFAAGVTKFQASAKQYPEALKFYTKLAKPSDGPRGKPDEGKADERY